MPKHFKTEPAKKKEKPSTSHLRLERRGGKRTDRRTENEAPFSGAERRRSVRRACDTALKEVHEEAANKLWFGAVMLAMTLLCAGILSALF